MPERNLLRQHFTDLLSKAQKTVAEYNRLAQTAADTQHRQLLQELAHDQQRQVELSERLLEIVDA
jgi:hypothetical protein